MNYGEITVAIINVKDNNPVEAIQELLRSMLEKGLVSAILVPQEIPSHRTVIQTLVRDSAKLNEVNPLAPVFGVNSARIVAQMCVDQMKKMPSEWDAAEQPEQETEKEPEQEQKEGSDTTVAENEAPVEQKEEQPARQEQESSEQETAEQETAEQESSEEAGEQNVSAETQSAGDEQPAVSDEESKSVPIALVLRPCEIRALVELVKLQQVDLDPFLVIGVDCWGTYSVEDYAAKVEQGSKDSSVTADFLEQVTAGNLPQELRGACRVCQYPAPTYSDLAIQLIGEDIKQQFRLQGQTEKGKELLKALGLEETPESEGRQDALAKIRDPKKKLAEEEVTDFLEIISSLCINCRNCRAVCPICYCKQCVFDGDVFKYPLEKYLNLSGKKGVLGMPPDKLLFHLTRMSHVATSCAACGQCEAACPNGIPLGLIYQKISSAVQGALEYEAGRSLDEELPLTTFREDELSVVED